MASSSISLPLPHSSAVFISRARLHFVPSLIFFLPFNLFSSFFCALSSCLSLSPVFDLSICLCRYRSLPLSTSIPRNFCESSVALSLDSSVAGAASQRRRSGETKKFILFSSSDDVATKLASVPVSIRRVFHVDAHWTSMEPCQQLG